MKRMIKTLTMSALLATAVMADLPAEQIQFPRDLGGHLSNTSFDELTIFENWFYSGKLESIKGENLSYTCAVFGSEIEIPTGDIITVHWAYITVIDQDKSLLYVGNVSFNNDQVQYSNEKLDINYNDQFIIKGANNNIEQVNCTVADNETGKELALSLFLHPSDKQALLPNGNGMVDAPGEGNWRFYSKPNQPTSGAVTIGNKNYTIDPTESESFATHFWGDNFPSAGWDFFTVSLDNDISALCFLHADSDRNITDGSLTLSMPDGSTKVISMDDFTYEKFNYWTSPKYDQTFPLNYRISIPELDLTFNIDAKFAEQEVQGMFDGITNVTAEYEGTKVKGSGSMNINLF